MRRREFLAGTALILGLAKARAQSSASMPRLGWLMTTSRPVPPNYPAFIEALELHGWLEGKTIQIDRRSISDGPDRATSQEAQAKELVALQPDVIYVGTSQAVDAVRRKTTTIPIVFVAVNDPLAAGFVSSLAHPGGNITGFANFEPSVIGKMIELLKEVVPDLSRVALMYNAGAMRDWIISGATVSEAARVHSVEVIDTPVQDEGEIERTFEILGEDHQAVAVIVLADGYLMGRRDLIATSAAHYRVPTISPFSAFSSAGCLVSYGSSLTEQARQAAGYVDRILRGAHPADLPVQMPTKYELTINLKAAKALGLTVPPTLLARADEVIE
jgi:putative ABC transport system substrate-binding protein